MKRFLGVLIAVSAPTFLFAATPSTTKPTTAEAHPVAPKSKTYVVNVSGMTCGSCAQKVEASIMKLDGIQGVSVDHNSGRTVVMIKESANTSLDQVKAAIKDAGYEVKG